MGDQVGQLAYGIEINQEQFGSLIEGYKLKKELQNSFPLVEVENPYETEDNYIFIKGTSKQSYNGGKKIGKQIATNPEWDEQLKTFCDAVNIPFDAEKACWHLIGHYN